MTGRRGLTITAVAAAVATLCAAAAAAQQAQTRPAQTEQVADSADVPFLARLVARSFFNGLLAGEVDAVVPLLAPRVDFDGEVLTESRAIEARIRGVIERVRHRRVRLQRLVVLDATDMHRWFGPPPRRLKRTLRRGQLYALARFDRLGAIAVLERRGRFYRIVALTD